MTVTEIIAELNRATRSDQEMRTRIIRELASHPDEVFEVMIDALEVPPKSLWPVAVAVLREIGFPRNALAIPRLIEHVANLNSTASKEAGQTLTEMGPHAVVPYLLEILLDESRLGELWFEAVAGICLMLDSIDREFAALCGPAIICLLSREIPASELDPGYLLDVLEKIGPHGAEYALPGLIQLMKKEGASENGQQAQKLIASFDQRTLEPYKFVLGEHHPIFVRKSPL